MTSEKRIAANRSNARKSRGPRTAVAKSRVSVNASRNAPSGAKLRIIGYLDAGSQAHLYARPREIDGRDLGLLLTPSTVAREIRGDSLGSHFNHWFVLYDDLRLPPTRDLLGQLCVVSLADGRLLVKGLQQGKTKGRFDLISNFGPAIRNVAVVWAALVKSISQPR
jgi:hypothetical protein